MFSLKNKEIVHII